MVIYSNSTHQDLQTYALKIYMYSTDPNFYESEDEMR